jgi:dihydroxyacetone kinase
MTTSLLSSASNTPQPELNAQFFGTTALSALDVLKQRTAARVGHRTVMDALIPFAIALANSGDLATAVQECRKGGEATATMQAKLGRATYVGEIEGKQMPPDPGAMAFVTVVEGILKAFK